MRSKGLPDAHLPGGVHPSGRKHERGGHPFMVDGKGGADGRDRRMGQTVDRDPCFC
jgi:hypothetical protein